MYLRLAGYRDEKFLLPRSTDYFPNLRPKEVSLWVPGLQLKGLLYLERFNMGDYLSTSVLKYANDREANVIAWICKSEHKHLCSLLSMPPEFLI